MSVLLAWIAIGTQRVINHGFTVHSFIHQLNLSSSKVNRKLRSSFGVPGDRMENQSMVQTETQFMKSLEPWKMIQASNRPGTLAPVYLTSRDHNWSSWKSSQERARRKTLVQMRVVRVVPGTEGVPSVSQTHCKIILCNAHRTSTSNSEHCPGVL